MRGRIKAASRARRSRGRGKGGFRLPSRGDRRRTGFLSNQRGEICFQTISPQTSAPESKDPQRPTGATPSGKASSSEPARPERRERRAGLRNPPLPGSLWDTAGKRAARWRAPAVFRSSGGDLGDEPRVRFAGRTSRLHPERDQSGGNFLLTALAGYKPNKNALASRFFPFLEVLHRRRPALRRAG